MVKGTELVQGRAREEPRPPGPPAVHGLLRCCADFEASRMSCLGPGLGRLGWVLHSFPGRGGLVLTGVIWDTWAFEDSGSHEVAWGTDIGPP